MVFLNGDDSFFTRSPSIYDVVKAQASRAKPPYDANVAVFSTSQDIVEFLKAHPPVSQPAMGIMRTFGQSNLTLKLS